jgi:multidrug resistance efflux pump
LYLLYLVFTPAEQLRLFFDMGSIPRVELEAASDAFHTAQATLKSATVQLSSAQAQLDLLKRSQKVTVVSPIDGQIMQLGDIHAGQVLGERQYAIKVLPQGVPLIFRGSALGHDRPKLQLNSPVQIAWSGYPKQKYGVTKGILKGVSPTSEADSDGHLKYIIEVHLPQSDQGAFLGLKRLVPGMQGEAHVLSDDRTVLNLFWDWVRGLDPWN